MSKIIDLSKIITSVGSHTIGVKATDGVNDSALSNTVNYTVEALAITNKKAGGTLATTATPSATATYQYTFTGTPTSVTVNGVTSTSSVTVAMVAGGDQSSTITVTVGGLVTLKNGTGRNIETMTHKTANISFSDGTDTDTDTIDTYSSGTYDCYAKGTLITLADRTTKPVEEITYDDELLIWDFDNGKYAAAKPLWIKTLGYAAYYYHFIFDDESTLDLIGSGGNAHRLYDCGSRKFVYSTECVGRRIFAADGTKKRLVACARIDAEVEYYNIITAYHINLFAGGVLTSCRLNNIYDIDKNMTFIKDDREIVPRESFSDVPAEYYEKLRLGEQKFSAEEIEKYVAHLLEFAQGE